MTAPRPLPRLAARQGIRQVEAHVRADAAADAVDRAVGRVWREVLALLRRADGPGGALIRLTAGPAARQLFGGLLRRRNDILAAALAKIVAWGHRSAAAALRQELPRKVVDAAVTGEVLGATDLRTERQRGVVLGSGLGRPLRLRAEQAARGLAVLPVHESIQRHELTEAVDPDLAPLLFPAPTPAETDAIVYATGWRERLAAGTRLASPELLAGILSRGIAAGKGHREIAKELLPHVEGVRASARRVARTEALRVAAATQMRCHEQLGDLVVGYQVHATLDQHTRPEHAARSGTVYYARPGPGQPGYDRMPNPPHESLADGNKLAFNCRCWLSPILRPLEGEEGRAVVPADVPDPLIYGEWFAAADERRRRIAVGARRYSLLSGLLDRPPEWADFLDPEAGSLLSKAELTAETPLRRAERAAKVRAWLAELRRLAALTSAWGFVPG